MKVLDEAVRLYIDSCGILGDEGQEQMAFDTYRVVTNPYLKLERFSDAVGDSFEMGFSSKQM